MYSLTSHGEFIDDQVRIEAYMQALRGLITADSVVLDIGTGVGIMAFMACKLGARHVYAVEPSSAIQVAREAASANGYAGRIDFLQGMSTDISLPEPATIVVSDLRGTLPFFHSHIPSIIDARQRLLAPGGILIPWQDTLWLAPVESPELYEPIVSPWISDDLGLDWNAARRRVLNNWLTVRVKPQQLLAQASRWATVDYSTVMAPDVAGGVTLLAERHGTFHGFAVWFDASLAEGVGFSNAPGAPKHVYGSAFFPLLQPVSVHEGDSISIGLTANLVGSDYVWGWRTRVLDGKGCETASFRQSTFFETAISPDNLHKRDPRFVPVPNADAEIDGFILSALDGKRTVSEVAARLAERFPDQLGDNRTALDRVREISARYAR